jgi:hypothetical protein
MVVFAGTGSQAGLYCASRANPSRNVLRNLASRCSHRFQCKCPRKSARISERTFNKGLRTKIDPGYDASRSFTRETRGVSLRKRGSRSPIRNLAASALACQRTRGHLCVPSVPDGQAHGTRLKTKSACGHYDILGIDSCHDTQMDVRPSGLKNYRENNV